MCVIFHKWLAEQQICSDIWMQLEGCVIRYQFIPYSTRTNHYVADKAWPMKYHNNKLYFRSLNFEDRTVTEEYSAFIKDQRSFSKQKTWIKMVYYNHYVVFALSVIGCIYAQQMDSEQLRIGIIFTSYEYEYEYRIMVTIL